MTLRRGEHLKNLIDMSVKAGEFRKKVVERKRAKEMETMILNDQTPEVSTTSGETTPSGPTVPFK